MLTDLRRFTLLLVSSLCLSGCATLASSQPRPDRNVGMVIREIKNSDQGPGRTKLVKYLDDNYPTDGKVIDFCLDVINRRDWLMLSYLSDASHIKSSRLIEPLMECMRFDQSVVHAGAHATLVMLRNQRPVMADRRQISSELGQIMLGRSRWFGPTAADPADEDQWYYWQDELKDLALTGDPALIPVFMPWLDCREVVVDSRRIAIVNNNVSTRVCDATYNAFRVLLDLPREDFSYMNPRRVSSVEAEYLRRDALIEQLKKQLAAHE